LDGGDGGRCGCEGGGSATAERGKSVRLSLFRHIHRLRFILHAQSLHWSDHRQFQHAKEKGECLVKSQSLKYFKRKIVCFI